MVLAVMVTTSSLGMACDEKGAFGFEFGRPVPAEASKQMIGGSGMGCFDGIVPLPWEGFDKYSYCANRDRKFVYSIDARRNYAGGKVYDAGMPDAAEVKAKATQAITEIKDAWEKKFGLKYASDYSHGLRWTAETPAVASVITISGPYVVVDCTNRSLESKAMGIAIKSL
jgi:hypothetical protein